MTENFDDSLRRIQDIGTNIQKMLDEITGNEVIDDFIYTEQQEKEWLNTVPTFTKRIYTAIPTKRRRRVTLSAVTLP
ncbi:MAG: hypothetical protein ABSF82_07860 [Candidatus Bathyarchaeia archaeon]|jgi:hypothetical protein